MPPKQDAFDFPDEPKGPPQAEPSRPAQVTPQGTSICHYCGERMPASRLESTPAVGDDQRWAMITPYHNFGCRWIESRGLKLEEGSHS
jgi:hypothetical protein